MNRRALLAATCRLALAVAGLVPAAGLAQPRHTVSLGQLQRVLEQRFPRRYPVSGLVDFDLQVPRLRLLPQQNRLGSELPIDVAGPALRRRYSGSVDLDFALRYEPVDQTIRAHGIRVNAAHIEGLRPDAARLLDAYLRSFAEQAMLEVVLHKLRQEDLALANTMGFEPGAITVTPDGLEIGFVPVTKH